MLLIKMVKTVNSYFSFMWLFHGLTATTYGFFHNQMSSEMASVSLTVQNRIVLIIRVIFLINTEKCFLKTG